MRVESHRVQQCGRMRNPITLLAFSIALFFLTRWIVHTARAADDTAKESPALARFSSWVLFGGRAVEGAPFLAYGYLSEIARN